MHVKGTGANVTHVRKYPYIGIPSSILEGQVAISFFILLLRLTIILQKIIAFRV
jgi:hypothetical protein